MSQIPNDLKEAIRSGAAIPFCGAGVSMSVRRKGDPRPAFPSWTGLLKNAAAALDDEAQAEGAVLLRSRLGVNPPLLLEAATDAEKRLGPRLWTKFLKSQFEVPFESIDDASLALPRALWELSNNLLITSNYDLVLRWACSRKDNLREWALNDPAGVQEVGEGVFSDPAVWHVHGFIQRPHSLVLTLNGYEKLYVDPPSSEWKQAQSTLQQVVKNKTLIFVGFSFTDEYFSDEVKGVLRSSQGFSRDHYVLTKRTDCQAMTARFEADGLRVRCIPFDDYGAPLVDLVLALARLKAPSPAGGSTPPSGPVAPPSSDQQPSSLGLSSIARDVMALVGSWDPAVSADRETVKSLGVDPMELERSCIEASKQSGSLVRSRRERNGGLSWGLSDHRAALLSWGTRIPASFFRQLKDAAENVLSELDPSLDEPKEERIYAALRGKVLVHSEALREGVAESLAILSTMDAKLHQTHGADFGSGIAASVVANVLKKDWRSWGSLDSLLPLLAESAPRIFLQCVEVSLAHGVGGLRKLLDQETHFSVKHSGLLWGLETIAWIPECTSLVALILSRLASQDPGGTFSNRPLNSLLAILSPLLPQSFLNTGERLQLTKAIAVRDPQIGWKLAITALGSATSGQGILSESRRPVFAQWPARGPATELESPDVGSLLGLALEFCPDDRGLALIIEKYHELPTVGQTALLKFVEARFEVAASLVVDAALRRQLYNGYQFMQSWGLTPESLDALKSTYVRLRPKRLVDSVAWLFGGDRNVPEPIVGGWREESKRLRELQLAALDQVRASDHWQQVLAELSGAVVSNVMLGVVLAHSGLAPEVTAVVLSGIPKEWSLFAAHFLAEAAARDGDVKAVFRELLKVDAGSALLFLVATTPTPGVWELSRELGEDAAREYWRLVPRVFASDAGASLGEAVRALVQAGRVSDALELASDGFDGLASDVAVDLLEALSRQAEESELRLVGSLSYYVERVFVAADRSDSADVQQRILRLELVFFSVLQHTARSLRLLFGRLESEPAFVVELLALAMKTDADADSERPSELTPRQQKAAGNAWTILHDWNGFPGRALGQGRTDVVVLWSKAVLERSAAISRGRSGAALVGRVLARVPTEDSLWPSEAARIVLRDAGVPALVQSMVIEKRNMRGATSRPVGEGGRQEKKLSEEFRGQASLLREVWPEAAGVCLSLADAYLREAAREDEEASADREQYRMVSQSESNIAGTSTA